MNKKQKNKLNIILKNTNLLISNLIGIRLLVGEKDLYSASDIIVFKPSSG